MLLWLVKVCVLEGPRKALTFEHSKAEKQESIDNQPIDASIGPSKRCRGRSKGVLVKYSSACHDSVCSTRSMAVASRQKRAQSHDPTESGGLGNILDADLPNEWLSPIPDRPNHSKRQRISRGLS